MLYKVWIKNPYFELGAVYRKFDDGFEKCVMEDVGGRQQVVGYEGLVVPGSMIAPYVIAIRKNGIDHRALANRQKQADYDTTLPEIDEDQEPERWGL